MPRAFLQDPGENPISFFRSTGGVQVEAALEVALYLYTAAWLPEPVHGAGWPTCRRSLQPSMATMVAPNNKLEGSGVEEAGPSAADPVHSKSVTSPM